MGGVYVLSPFGPIFIVKSVQGGGGFSSGHKWGILGGHQGTYLLNENYGAFFHYDDKVYYKYDFHLKS